EVEIPDIEEAAYAGKVFGRVKVRDTQLDAETGSKLVLCECGYKVDPDRIPSHLQSLNGDSKWKVVLLTESVETANEFSAKLHKLLREEGKTVNDVHALLSTDAPQASSPESIIQAVGDLLGRTMRPTNENNAFRRLHMFSGSQPTPVGEENMEQWLDQARLMIEECDCSDREKRKRIVESLKGPALEIIQAVRLGDPDASPDAYVEALESAFGIPESGEDLYFAFRSLHQQSSEKLSDFLRRLERLLTKVVQKGGLPSHRADRARIDQLIRGATESDMMLLHLRLRERRDKPPTFLKLLNEIREEEGTIPDQYTMPRIDDALDCLTGSKWFSVLDLRSGYYQVEMSEADKEKTAFICPLGFFQFERMPQGITGAPATFQRLMERAVGDMNMIRVLVYLDDLIVFGKTLEEHEERLLKVLDRLKECGLKVSIDKCQFCQPQVKFLGHIVSASGVATDPE
ncbi:hypothetical protein QTP86_031795, partial [Hemibagrus guttatus]